MRERRISKKGLVVSLAFATILAGLSMWLYFTAAETPHVSTKYAEDLKLAPVKVQEIPADIDGGGLLAAIEPDWAQPPDEADPQKLGLLRDPMVAGGEEVPEPSSIVLLALGGFALLRHRRKRVKT